jgi:hypothetical protein
MGYSIPNNLQIFVFGIKALNIGVGVAIGLFSFRKADPDPDK